MDARLRAHALAERGRLDALLGTGRPLDRPQVVLLDEVPVMVADSRVRITGVATWF